MTSWSLPRVWLRRVNIVELLTLVVTTVGIFYVLVELAIARYDRSVDQTLSFVERFNSQNMIEARRGVQKPWLDLGVQLAAFNTEDGLSKEQIALLGSKIMQVDRQKDGDLQSHILLITAFFDELSTCMEFACNPDVACKYFSETVADFRLLYEEVLKGMAQGFDMNGIGYGLYDPQLAAAEGEECRNPSSWPLFFALSRH